MRLQIRPQSRTLTGNAALLQKRFKKPPGKEAAFSRKQQDRGISGGLFVV